jgi:hypothetical protein
MELLATMLGLLLAMLRMPVRFWLAVAYRATWAGWSIGLGFADGSCALLSIAMYGLEQAPEDGWMMRVCKGTCALAILRAVSLLADMRRLSLVNGVFQGQSLNWTQ